MVSLDVQAKSLTTSQAIHALPLDAYSIILSVQTDTTILYWGGYLPDGFSEHSFSLPPVPPTGVTDIRFEQDSRWSPEGTAIISVSQYKDPIHLTIQPSEQDSGLEEDFHVDEFVNSIAINNLLIQPNQTVSLDARTTRVELRKSEMDVQQPVDFTLDQNYPNPFNPTTTIRFGLPEAADVRLEVYTVLGQKVKTLINENRSAGWHTVTLNASDLSSGVYVYRIQAGGVVQTRKLMLVK